MLRKIITIDEGKCNGCGACAEACHEGAIGMIGGKAKLLRDDYCDGLGNCLPVCPTGAITFEEREAAEYNEEEVRKKMQQKVQEKLACGCPGTQARKLERKEEEECSRSYAESPSRLQQWPVQLKLAPVNAPYFKGANLLVAADCAAYAYANFHEKFIKNRITVIGCPKLDMVDYTEKLTEIIRLNDIKSVMVVRMEVPCCGGIEFAVKNALQKSGKFLPWQVVTITTGGEIID
ncbi:MAG: 4Fe-4S binding protein [Clostridia bacterium]|nr:4Fe-4S binding protein [Clostridia bacterium]